MANPLQPPQLPNNLMPPPAIDPNLLAPSPSLGFGIWAQSPQNAMKVMPSMTKPDQPLQPNAGQQQPAPMASVNPPPVQSPLTPPQAQGINPTNALMPPPLSPAQSQLGTDSAELQRLQNNGAGVNQIKNKPLRILAKIADAAGTILAPGVASVVPGTTVHNWTLQNQQQGRVAGDQAAVQAQTQAQKDAADIAHTQAETAAIPINSGIKQQAAQSNLAQHGLKVEVDKNGMTKVVPDEDSPVYQAQQSKQQLADAQIEVAKANVELKKAQADYNAAKTDPNSPLFKQTAQRLTVAQQNASAAGERAQAYMGRYLQSAFNTDLKGNVLPGATEIADEGGKTTTVGTGNASQAVKSQANVAQFNDIEGATNNIEKAATNLVNKGGKLNSPAVAAAIADPASTSGQWAQGQFATSGLTPEERDYVVQVKAYKENLQSLRKSAGGGVSDSQVDRLMALAPGAATPDLDYLKRQTGQIRQMRARLAQGVSTAGGGLKVQGRGNPMKPPALPSAASGSPKEGATKVNSAGDKVVFHNGAWGPA